MHHANTIYHNESQEHHGFLAFDNAIISPRPAVLVAHDWSGRNEFACDKAKMLADMGYVGFALDMYGQAQLGQTTEEKMALITPLMSDRALLLERVNAALDVLRAMPEVDANRIAIIGFCFGGLCALDLARSGADIKGAISFHGLLNKPENKPITPIKAKILALHGYEDPMVKPDQLTMFCDEMTAANADWQVQMYGHVQHSFTNPQAHDRQLGLIYNELAAKRAWQAMTNFLQEIF